MNVHQSANSVDEDDAREWGLSLFLSLFAKTKINPVENAQR